MNRRFRSFWLCSLVCLILSAQPAAAETSSGFHNGLSLQGFTGVLNTPSAHVTDEGWLNALYSNQVEPQWRRRGNRGSRFEDNFQFSLGFFNFIELGGRFIEAPGNARDLSASVKVSTAPLTGDLPLVPVLGAGIQDLGGGATLLRTKYLVVSEDLWRLRLSAGYGWGPDRMQGTFAGAELKLHDWVYLLGDYDTRETNLGARVVLPQFWKVPVRFTGTVKTSLDYRPGNFDFAVGFSLPLDFQMRRPPEAIWVDTPAAAGPAASAGSGREQAALQPARLTSQVPAPAAPPPQTAAPDTARPGQASGASAAPPAVSSAGADREPDAAWRARLQDRLAGIGLLNLRIGTRERTLVVEYENTVFNHNELDALGVVAGQACQEAPSRFDTLQLVIKRRDLRVAVVTAPFYHLRRFLAGTLSVEELREVIGFDDEAGDAAAAEFAGGKRNPGLFNTSLILAPALTTFLGTENGAFDYLLSLRPELSTMLWKGALLAARWDIPVAWSFNLEDGRPYRSSRRDPHLDRLMLFQAIAPAPSLMVQLGAGKILNDRYGTLNEVIWSPGDGQHRFRVTQAWHEDQDARHPATLLLGSYRYYLSALDLFLEGTGGRFWSEDQGVSVEVKRFWRDAAVSLYYKNTRGTDDKRWQAVGLQLSFPLTPRRDMRPLARLQVRGSDEWSYAQETTLKNNNIGSSRGSLNYLAPYPLAINPQPTQALYRSFYNRDRLNQSYLLEHLERLREAWLKYRTQP